MKNFLQDMDDETLVRYLLDEAGDQEKENVRRWIAFNAENARYFNHFELIWQISKSVAGESTISEDAAWSGFKERLAENEQGGRIVTIKSGYRKLLLAASVILVPAIAALLYLINVPAPKPVHFASNDTVVTDTLPDQSVVTLNKHSELRYQETAGDSRVRRATLKGEGFFNIKPDKSKPFIVLVDEIEVSVVGTSFNIRSTADSTVIIVETGIVNVMKDQQTIELKKGESLTVPRIGNILPKRTTPDRLYDHYRSREFVCDNTPLWKLVEVLNEAYATKIVLENRPVRNSPYTATFHDEPIDKIAAVIAETFELSIVKKGDTIVLK